MKAPDAPLGDSRANREEIMIHQAFRRQSVAGMIESYVAARVGTKRPISTADVVRMIRQALPDCEHTDPELVNLIATIAVSKGCDVAFDPPLGKAGKLSDLPPNPEIIAAHFAQPTSRISVPQDRQSGRPASLAVDSFGFSHR